MKPTNLQELESELELELTPTLTLTDSISSRACELQLEFELAIQIEATFAQSYVESSPGERAYELTTTTTTCYCNRPTTFLPITFPRIGLLTKASLLVALAPVASLELPQQDVLSLVSSILSRASFMSKSENEKRKVPAANNVVPRELRGRGKACCRSESDLIKRWLERKLSRLGLATSCLWPPAQAEAHKRSHDFRSTRYNVFAPHAVLSDTNKLLSSVK